MTNAAGKSSSLALGHSSLAPQKKRACDSCHKRKIHCDNILPNCNWCKHHGLACTFNRVTRVRKGGKIVKASKQKSVAERIEQLENFLTGKIKRGELDQEDTSRLSLSTQDSPRADESSPSGSASASEQAPPALTPDSSSVSSPGGAFGKLHFAGFHLGGISSYNGIPFFSDDGRRWIQDRAGTTAAFQSLLPLWQNQQHIHESFLLPYSNLELPPRQAVDDYFAVFRSNAFRLVFPVVDLFLFQDTIDMAYGTTQKPFSMEPMTAKACVFSFLSINVLMHGRIEGSPPVDGDACAIKAQFLFPQIMLETNITALQICIMQCMYYLFSGKVQTAAMFHAIACRMVFVLGGHTQHNFSFIPPGQEPSTSWRLKSHARKLFWLCYIFDKDIALRTGQPPVIDDEHCDLTLPPDYLRARAATDDTDGECRTKESLAASSMGTTIDISLLPGDLRLCFIKSKTTKLLYSAEALRKSDAELLRDIRELDDELERWRMTICPKYRPTLSHASSTDARIESVIDEPKRMHIMMCHFEYHHLMATIHRASGRCRAWHANMNSELNVSGNGGMPMMEGVSSSLALSVQASRSTLVFLRAAVHALMGESFWMIIFYPMSAIITLFCNILLNPKDPVAKHDLELLNSAPKLIKAMRIRRLTPNEMIHMKMVEDFVAELTRLCNSAVVKAS